jgi:hypothetical protein
MTDDTPFSEVDLEHARDVGAVTYISAYYRLIMKALNVEEPENDDAINAMVLISIEPMNAASVAIFAAMMNDKSKMEQALAEFRERLDTIIPQ